MDFSINFDFFSCFLNLYSYPFPKINNLFLYFKLSNSRFSRNFQNIQTQTQNPNTHKMENANPYLNLFVLLGACLAKNAFGGQYSEKNHQIVYVSYMHMQIDYTCKLAIKICLYMLQM